MVKSKRITFDRSSIENNHKFNISPPLLYSSWFMFLISTRCTLLALAQFLTILCNPLSIFWKRMDRAVTTEETRTTNRARIKTY